MQGIPKEIRVPPNMAMRSRVTGHASYIESQINDVSKRFGMEVVEDDSLVFPSPLAVEITCGPIRAAIDFNDLPSLPPCAGQYDFWLKFQTISAHRPFGNVYPFCPPSFTNWEQYRLLREDIHFTGQGTRVLYVQESAKFRGEQWGQDLLRRRSLVKELLRENFGEQVDMEYSDQLGFWRRATASLLSVHVPGLWNNMLGRAQLQMFAFGVCTISPMIYTQPGTEPLLPDVHYIRCRDDYSDLVSLIVHLQKQPEMRRRIGVEAKRFFDLHCTPEKVWTRLGTLFSESRVRMGG